MNRIHCIIDSLMLHSVVFVIMYMVLLVGAMVYVFNGDITSLIMPTVLDTMIAYVVAFDLVEDYRKAKEEDLAE